MARGTQHRKRRPRANARSGAVAAAAPPRKQKPPAWQDELFFSRLRVHAKWMFVLLAICFGLGFVVFGVGSGSTGISDALQSAFHFGSSGGTSIGSLKGKVTKNPKNATAWRDLATAYEQKQQTQNAIDALVRFTALQPKNQDGLTELASEYSTLAETYATAAQTAQLAVTGASPSTDFEPASTTPLGRAFNDPEALQDPIGNAVEQQATAEESDAYTKVTSTERSAEGVYEALAKLSPKDATTQLQLGQAAQTAGDTDVAEAAYAKFLKLAPTDPLAPQVKAQLKSLTATSGTASAAGSSG